VVTLHTKPLAGMDPPEALIEQAIDLVGGEEIRQVPAMRCD
jgi:hypothetical protein